MPEKTKPKENDEKQSEKVANKTEDEDASNKSQPKKSYYYDDAYGYEIYKLEEDEEED